MYVGDVHAACEEDAETLSKHDKLFGYLRTCRSQKQQPKLHTVKWHVPCTLSSTSAIIFMMIPTTPRQNRCTPTVFPLPFQWAPIRLHLSHDIISSTSAVFSPLTWSLPFAPWERPCPPIVSALPLHRAPPSLCLISAPHNTIGVWMHLGVWSLNKGIKIQSIFKNWNKWFHW